MPILISMKKTYELFSGKELEIAELIQQRRYQILVHSCIYYEMNQNLISDRQFDIWARELVRLQKEYPEISANVVYADAFADWDASTGAFLPLKDEAVVRAAKKLLGGKFTVAPTQQTVTTKRQPTKVVDKSAKTKRRKLF